MAVACKTEITDFWIGILSLRDPELLTRKYKTINPEKPSHVTMNSEPLSLRTIARPGSTDNSNTANRQI